MDPLQLAWLLGRVAAQLGFLSRAPTFREIKDKTVRKLHVLSKSLEAGGRPRAQLSMDERLVWWIMSFSDTRGSDVRVDIGSLSKPDRAVRQSVSAKWWKWKIQVSAAFADEEEHINAKEMRASMLELRRRARSTETPAQTSSSS